MNKWLQNFMYAVGILFAVIGTVAGVKNILHRHQTSSAVSAANSSAMTKEEMIGYLQQIAPIAQEVSSAMQEVAPIYNNPSDTSKKSQVLTQLQSTQNKFSSFTQRAKNVKVPQALSPLHQQFVDSIGKYQEAFKLSRKGFENNNTATVNEGASLLEKSSARFNEVSQEIASRTPQ